MSKIPKKFDEPFGSDDEDFGLMHKEWSKVDDGLKNAGVRDGLEFSQDHILQDGFNSAFRDALQMSLSAGKLQGSISAFLSCPSPTRSVKSEDMKHWSQLKLNPQTQLQELLTKNTNLLSRIPHILQPPSATGQTSGITGNSEANPLNETRDLGNFATHLAQNVSVNKCSELNDDHKESREERSPLATSRSCEKVCSNESHFWSQLESFKMQAGSLGVCTDNN